MDTQRHSEAFAGGVEGSMKRLRLERIDVYQLHVPDPAVSFDASMETWRGCGSRARSGMWACRT